MSTYRLYSPDRTDYTTEGTSPAKALRELCAAAGLQLETQHGRYGKTPEGHNLAALTEPWSRRRLDPMERQTRPLKVAAATREP